MYFEILGYDIAIQLFVIPRADHGVPARKASLWNETVRTFLMERAPA